MESSRTYPSHPDYPSFYRKLIREVFRPFEKPIDPKVFPRLRLEYNFAKGIYKSVCWDQETRDRYFVKRYRREVEDKALREELGLVLCSAYGAITPGHVLVYEKEAPILLQRMVPFSTTVGDFYRANMGPEYMHPDEPTRARLLSSLSRRQVTEVFICWITDYLIYNWDAHPDNYMMDSPGGSIVGIDKGLTGAFIEHPHLCLESPSVEGDLVHYVARVSKPANNVIGHIYEPVWTNVYRKIYKPDLNKISTVLDTVENLGATYDSYIRSVLDGSGLEAFIKRRETLRQAVDKLFSILELEP